MDVIDAILTRRSIRKYTGDKVSEEQVELLLKAAMYAPSASDRQPWQFVVINKKEILSVLKEAHPHAQMLSNASLAILLCGDEKLELAKGYWAVDCGAATQNLLLAAHNLGLGAVWLGLHPREERKEAIRKIFDLPDYIQPFSLISIGYPAEDKPVPQRYFEDKIHWNGW